MNVNVQSVTTTNAVTLTNKTIDEAVISGTPDAEGELGRDTTQLALNEFNNGMLGTIARVVAAGVGTQTFINSVATDQDFTSMITLPANTLFTNKKYRIATLFEFITGVSSVTMTLYLKLGSTKVMILPASDLTNSVNRTIGFIVEIAGRDAAGASASVTCANMQSLVGAGSSNTVVQPVTGLATNGTLTISWGVTYSGTGSTESIEQQAWTIEELN